MSATVTLQGRLVKDPELRFTNSGKACASFTVVTARRVNKGGNWEETETSFWDCTAWEKMAEGVAESLTKGSLVIVIGRMAQEEWEDKEGNKRKSWKVRADDIGASLKWGLPDREGNSSPRQESRPHREPPARPSGRPAAAAVYEDEPPF